MGGLVSQRFAKRPVGDAAGSKGLPEGFAGVLGHDVLSVIAGDQHHDMAGALPAFVTAMDFAWWLALGLGGALCCHDDDLLWMARPS